MLTAYQTQFIETALAVNALKFGEFTLKSGRQSPYFFNAGAFSDGQALTVMAEAYAICIKNSLEITQAEVLFGPAYKGIPLVAAIATILYLKHGINLPWAFNRKEAKDHGEGGMIVGNALSGKKVLIIDDVLTAGTAVRESLTLLEKEKAQPVGLIVALDRKEKITGSQQSALMQFAQETGIYTNAVINLDDLLSFVQKRVELMDVLEKMQAYRAQYGV